MVYFVSQVHFVKLIVVDLLQLLAYSMGRDMKVSRHFVDLDVALDPTTLPLFDLLPYRLHVEVFRYSV